jgi:hypothetical protein
MLEWLDDFDTLTDYLVWDYPGHRKGLKRPRPRPVQFN